MTSILDTVAMALGTLRANVLRSILTLLGIVIGASTVVGMMSLTEGLRLKLNTDFSVLGAGAFVVSRFPAVNFGPLDHRKYERRKHLYREQGDALRALPHVRAVSVEHYTNQRDRVSGGGRETKQNIDLVGAEPDYELTNGLTVAQGRFIAHTDVMLGRRVVFIGADVADLLFPRQDPIGQEVRIRGAEFEVIGVAERRGSILGLESKDGFVAVPWTTYEVAFGKAKGYWIGVMATTPEDTPKAIDEVTATLRRVRGVAPFDENDFEIFSNETMSDLFNNLARLVGAATFGVCALALLVGGIGVMNIMLVSVTERTREIGIRMALGARRRRILSQFLVESVALSALGGIVGVLAGAGLAVAARELAGIPASIPAWAVVLSLASASGAGLLFGIYPAARASKLDPVEAMRTE